MVDTDRLPYQLPGTLDGKIHYLAKLLRMTPSTLSGIPKKEAVMALTGVVLYQHLDSVEKSKIMTLIRSLPRDKQNQFIVKITDPMVSPYWGLWSLSTKDLLARKAFLDKVSTFAGMFGLSFSAKDGMKVLGQLRNASPVAVSTKMNAAVTVMIWGFFWQNENAKGQIEQEIIRRTHSFQ